PRCVIVDPEAARPGDGGGERSVHEQGRAALLGRARRRAEAPGEEGGQIALPRGLERRDASRGQRGPCDRAPAVTRRELLERRALQADDAVPGHGCLGAAPDAAGAAGALGAGAAPLVAGDGAGLAAPPPFTSWITRSVKSRSLRAKATVARSTMRS